MSDELRAPLIRRFEELATDLVIGRHGDPHVAFVVLVYPDREPSIVPITEHGSPRDLSHVQTADEATVMHARPAGRFFTGSDLSEAVEAMQDARLAFRTFSWRQDKSVRLGEHVVHEMAKAWERRRNGAAVAAMEAAAFEESHRAVCENCGRRFTERGIKMHHARSDCGGTESPRRRRPSRRTVRCPVRTCGWSGYDDRLVWHIRTTHRQYEVG